MGDEDISDRKVLEVLGCQSSNCYISSYVLSI
jgi:hypothetical protein